MPLEAPGKLESDEHTAALFIFDRAAVESRAVVDSESGMRGTLAGIWKYVPTPELQPAYAGAAQASEEKAAERPVFLVKAVTALEKGAFSIDVIMRWNREGGYFLRIGREPRSSLLLGMLHRGPGILEFQIPIRDASGKVSQHQATSTKLFEPPWPDILRYDEFYRWTLVYDGERTFRILVDGAQAFETSIPEGARFAPDAADMALGYVATGKSAFRGSFAAARISDAALPAWGSAIRHELIRPAMPRQFFFDVGGSDAPLASDRVRLDESAQYTPEGKAGWLQKPRRAFLNWFVPDRFDPDPDRSYKKGEYHILDPAQRDGLVFTDGEFFRIDLPDGWYWVRVGLGDQRKPLDIASVSANGEVIGDHLIVMKSRSVRGLAHVRDGKGLILSASTGNGGADMPIRNAVTGAMVSPIKWGDGGHDVPITSIEIVPYAPLPVVNQGGKLLWTGQGAPPEGFDSLPVISSASEMLRLPELTRPLDPWTRICVLAAALGTPQLPSETELQYADDLRGKLISFVKAHPEDLQGAWLLDSLDRFRHVLKGALAEENASELVFGARYDAPLRVADLGLEFKQEDPFYWNARFLAANAIWQRARTFFGFVNGVPDVFIREGNFAGYYPPGNLLREVRDAYPDFRIARIMLGEKLPVVDDWKPPVNAPEWAVLQYQLQRRIIDVVHYWINERMTPDGLLTGGIGDDVEVLGWWSPAIYLADDPLVRDAWSRMAETVWQETRGKGFSLEVDDVQHSSEMTSDALPMMLLIKRDTPGMQEALTRSRSTLGIFRDIWSGVNPDGYRMVKGSTMSASEIREGSGDVCYNLRLIVPLLWSVWFAPPSASSQETADLLVEYARSWRDAIMTEFDGKPRGIVPMAILWDRSKARLPKGTDWVDPGYWSNLFAYPGGYSEKIYDLMIAAYVLSGDQSFLEPIRFALSEYRKLPAAANESDTQASRGTFEWALRKGGINIGLAGANYRMVTGDTSFDDVLLRIAPPLTRSQILMARADSPTSFTNAMTPLLNRVKFDLERMDSNPETRTVMTKQTDMIPVSGSAILNAMATGMTTKEGHPIFDMLGDEVVLPSFQVTWQGTEGEVAALVTHASPEGLSVLLYNFGSKVKVIRPHFWGLKPGSYEGRLEEMKSDSFTTVREISKKPFSFTDKGYAVDISLPPGLVTRLLISPAKHP